MSACGQRLGLSRVPVWGGLALALVVGGCDDPRTAALRALDRRGVAACGAALKQAAAAGDMEVVDLLLAAGVFADRRDLRGRTPLFAAVERGDLGTAFRLIDAGADPDAATPDGTTVLSLAVARGEMALIDRLLDAGAWAGGRMPDGDTLVPWAIRHGRLLVLGHVLDRGALDPNQPDSAGNPLVHVALGAGRVEILEALLDRGADPSACDAHATPLVHAALARGDLELVEQLLELGADPAATDAAGDSLWHAAVAGGSRPVVEVLLGRDHVPAPRSGSGIPAVPALLAAGWPDLLPRLLELGADPNLADAAGHTPLDAAIAAGDAGMAALLVRHGARPGGGDWRPLLARLCRDDDHAMLAALFGAGVPAALCAGGDGQPGVESAVAAGRLGLARLLLRFDAPAGDALYDACVAGDIEAVDVLLEHGAHPAPARVPWLDTPLAAATRAGHARIVGRLLDYGANPETAGLEGQRPLAVAALLGHGRCARHLLDHGADPEAELLRPVRPSFAELADSTLQWTLLRDQQVRPLMLAAHSGCVEALRALLDHGAERNRYTRFNKRYAINFAARKGHIAAMRLLLGKDPHQEKRRIVINLSEQFARVFDPTGIEIFGTKVSTGRKGFTTPTGEFVITNKHRTWKSTLYHASMPYFQRFSCGDFGMHQGVVPGYPASHGCIRIPYGNAARMFELTDLGDRVQIIE